MCSPSNACPNSGDPPLFGSIWWPVPNGEAVKLLPQVSINLKLKIDPPRLSTESPVKWQSPWCTGADTISAYVYKAGGSCSELRRHLQDRPRRMPIIVHLTNGKATAISSNNHRSISLLSVADKILAWALLNRLTGHLGQLTFPQRVSVASVLDLNFRKTASGRE